MADLRWLVIAIGCGTVGCASDEIQRLEIATLKAPEGSTIGAVSGALVTGHAVTLTVNG